jgi:hypothetical protein
LTASGNTSRVGAASSTVQSTVDQVTAQAPNANTAIQTAHASAVAAETAIKALGSALDPTSPLYSAISAAENSAHQVTKALEKLGGVLGQAVSYVETLVVDTVGGLIGSEIASSTVGQVFEAFATADILFPAHKDRHNFSDRGIATHEYGHFTLCNLLDSVDAMLFAAAYDEAAASGFVTGQAPSAQGSVMNESFADFIASQVIGATNYGKPQNSISSANMNYCLASNTSCIEANVTNGPVASPDGGMPVGGPYFPKDGVTFNNECLRATSLYTDAFDGQLLLLGAQGPTNGNEWQTNGSGIAIASAAGPSANDEAVALPGSSLQSWISHTLSRGTLLREDNVFGGLADAMQEQNKYNWCQICQVFQLHTVDASGNLYCPESWVGPRPTFSLNGTTMSLTCTFDQGGCPAGTTPDSALATCDPACPIAGYVFDPLSLTCVPGVISW